MNTREAEKFREGCSSLKIHRKGWEAVEVLLLLSTYSVLNATSKIETIFVYVDGKKRLYQSNNKSCGELIVFEWKFFLIFDIELVFF